MKDLNEMKFLARLARNMGQPDLVLEESIRVEEELNERLFKKPEESSVTILKEELPKWAPGTTFLNRIPVKEDEAPAETNIVPKEQELIKQTVAAISSPKFSKPALPDFQSKEIDGIRKQLSEVMQKMGTLSWGGGGTGVVRINDTDDFDKNSYAEGRYLKWTNGMFRLRDVAADIASSTSFGVFLDTHTPDHIATAINTPQIVEITTTDIARGHSLGSNSNIIAQNTGVYNYQFSLQVTSRTSSKQDIYIWPRVNGINVNNSASVYSINSNDGNIIPAWNFVLSMNAGDSFQLMWAVTDLAVVIHGAAPVTADLPAIPTLILTVTQVGTL